MAPAFTTRAPGFRICSRGTRARGHPAADATASGRRSSPGSRRGRPRAPTARTPSPGPPAGPASHHPRIPGRRQAQGPLDPRGPLCPLPPVQGADDASAGNYRWRPTSRSPSTPGSAGAWFRGEADPVHPRTPARLRHALPADRPDLRVLQLPGLDPLRPGPLVLVVQMLDIGCWWLARLEGTWGSTSPCPSA